MISYRDPRVVFQIHRPDLGEGLVGSDYRSEIFRTRDEQRQVAEDMIADADASGTWPGKVVTKISEAGPFWKAEAADQDYLQNYPGGKNQFRPEPSAADSRGGLGSAPWTHPSREQRVARE